MKRTTIFCMAMLMTASVFAQYDWQNTTVPADAGSGNKWELQADMSDDFNYDFSASASETYINGKWKNFWHNAWDGPGPTQWKHENISVSGGHLNIKASRNGATKTFTNSGDGKTYTLPATQMGCMVSKNHVQYPVFVEAEVQIADAVFANNVWMISDDDYEEIDICENYGGSGDASRTGTAVNTWYAQHIHLSHHVFANRNTSNYKDYQPRDEEGVYGTWYKEDERADWTNGYTRIGVYWKNPNHLEYYINGQWVRTLNNKNYSYKDETGKTVSDIVNFNVLDKYNYTNGNGLTKPMKLIINIEAQDWNAAAGRYPTNAEINQRPNDHIMKVNWIRVYKPVGSEPSGGGTGGETGSTVTIEAENFTSTGGTYNDAFAGGSGYGAKKAGNVINYVNGGDWVEYPVSIPTEGYYNIDYRIATPTASSSIEFYVSGTLFNTTTISSTGGWDTYKTISASKQAYFTAGNHTVKLKAKNATWAMNIDKITLTYSGTKSARISNPIVENNEMSRVNIYPNPTLDKLYLEGVTSSVLVEKVDIYTITGKKILTRNINDINAPIDISTLSPGLYIFKMGENCTRKFIKR